MKSIAIPAIALLSSIMLLCCGNPSNTIPIAKDSDPDPVPHRAVSSVDSLLGEWQVMRIEKLDSSGNIIGVIFEDELYVHDIRRDTLITWKLDSLRYEVRRYRYIFSDSRIITEDFYADVGFKEDTLQLLFPTESIVEVHYCVSFDGSLPLGTDDLPVHDDPQLTRG